jgi:hypothetical protein
MSVRFLVVPGWGNSGATHWQTHLEASLDGASRVEMNDWLAPRAEHWIATLERRIAEGPPPVVIAHSLGCIAVAHVVARGRVELRAALLVAPADLDRDECPTALRGFGPVPTPRFPVPVTVVASDDDPHASLERSRALARAWGGEVEVVRGGGHINVASGHGPWPRARVLAQALATRTATRVAATG